MRNRPLPALALARCLTMLRAGKNPDGLIAADVVTEARRIVASERTVVDDELPIESEPPPAHSTPARPRVPARKKIPAPVAAPVADESADAAFMLGVGTSAIETAQRYANPEAVKATRDTRARLQCGIWSGAMLDGYKR